MRVPVPAPPIKECVDCETPYCTGCHEHRTCWDCGRSLCPQCHHDSHGDNVRRGRCQACGSRSKPDPDEEDERRPFRVLPDVKIELPPPRDPKAWRGEWQRRQLRGLRRLQQDQQQASGETDALQ